MNRRFSPTASQESSVETWLKSNGLRITHTFANRLIVDARGSAAQIDRAFTTSLIRYAGLINGRRATFYAPSTSPRIPSSVGGTIDRVLGLNDAARMTAPIQGVGTRVRMSDVRRHGFAVGEYFPSDFKTAYDVNSVITAAGANLAKQRIGIVMWCDPPSSTELNIFDPYVGSPVPTVVLHDYSGSPSQSGQGDQIESDMDVEYSAGVASGGSTSAVVDYYQATALSNYTGDSCGAGDETGDDTSLLNALNAAGTTSGSTMDQQISGSFGNCNIGDYDSVLASDTLTGHNFFFSSGDSGSGICGSSHASYPASSPYATGVGGTSFDTCTTAPPNPITSYPGEVAWCNSQFIGSGGGLDLGYSTPYWQQKIPSTWNKFSGCLSSGTCRGVPDVSGPADPGRSGAYVCANADLCTRAGGTSLASPMWAGFLADINADFAAHGRPAGVGPVLPELYTLAYNSTTYARDFHDITGGSNGGYSAATGWDPVTGLGSPDLANLEADWFKTKADQAITFSPLPAKVVFDPPFTVSATAALGLNVNFTATGNCSAGGTNGTTITITGVGSCTVTAHQSGDSYYNPAPTVSQSFNIAPKYTQAITFGLPAPVALGDPPLGLTATAGSGLAVNFTSAGACSAGGTGGATITFNSVGLCTVTAHQSGGTRYYAAPERLADVSRHDSGLMAAGRSHQYRPHRFGGSHCALPGKRIGHMHIRHRRRGQQSKRAQFGRDVHPERQYLDVCRAHGYRPQNLRSGGRSVPWQYRFDVRLRHWWRGRQRQPLRQPELGGDVLSGQQYLDLSGSSSGRQRRPESRQRTVHREYRNHLHLCHRRRQFCQYRGYV